MFIALPVYVLELATPLFAHVSKTMLVGLLISLFGWVFSGLQPLTGALSNPVRFQKPLIMAGPILMGVGTLAFLLARQFSYLVLIRLLQGLGVAIRVRAGLAIMARSTEKRTRGASMGVYSGLRLVGFAIGPPVGGYLHLYHGVEAVFTVGGGFILLSALLVHDWVDESERSQRDMGPAPEGLAGRKAFSREILALGVATLLMAT